MCRNTQIYSDTVRPWHSGPFILLANTGSYKNFLKFVFAFAVIALHNMYVPLQWLKDTPC